MKILRLGIITFIAFLAQTTFLKYFSVYGIIPNLMAVFAICYSLTETDFTKAAVYGLLCGIMLDFSAETIFGLHALLCMFSSIACVLASKKFFKGKMPVSILLVFVISFAYEILYCVMSFALHENIDKINAVFGTALPEAVYNAAVSFFVLLIMKHAVNAENN